MAQTDEIIFNHELADAIEKAKRNNVQISHIAGILAVAQYKIFSNLEKGR